MHEIKKDTPAKHPYTLTSSTVREAGLELIHLAQSFQPKEMFEKFEGRYLMQKRALAGLLGTSFLSLFSQEQREYLTKMLTEDDKKPVFEVGSRIGFGSQFSVYLLKSRDPAVGEQLVIKCMKPVADTNQTNEQVLFHTSFDRNEQKNLQLLQQTAEILRTEYEYVESIYDGLNVLIPESIFIGIDPVYGKETPCILEPFIGVTQDVFELNDAFFLSCSTELKQEIVQFATRTLEHITTGYCIDILNPGNVVLAMSATGELHIKIIDPHVIFVVDRLQKNERDALEEKKIYLERLVTQ